MKPFILIFFARCFSIDALSLSSRTCDGPRCSPGSSHGPGCGTRAQGLVEPALLLLLLLLRLLRLSYCCSGGGIFGEAER